MLHLDRTSDILTNSPVTTQRHKILFCLANSKSAISSVIHSNLFYPYHTMELAPSVHQ